MMIKLAPALLLSVLCGSNDGVAAFSTSRPAVVAVASRPSSGQAPLAMSNDFDADYDVEVDRRGNIQNIARRNALARIAATAAVSATLLTGGTAAFAADDKLPEFSESPTSESSIARMAYDGKGAAPETAPASEVQEAASEAASSSAPEAKSSSNEDFDGNEAGSVGATDEGSQPSDKKAGSSTLPKLDLSDKKVLGLGAGGAFVALLGLAGLSGGETEGEIDEATGKPKWKLDPPTPYGIANPAASNPFLTEVLEYCEGGKVSAPCAQVLKTKLDDISETGAVATPEEVEAMAGYVDSLAPEGGKAGEAFASYLNVLSEGSAPPPSSAKAVKTYLDNIGGGGVARKAAWNKSAASGPAVAATPAQPAMVEPTVAAAPYPDFSAYDGRLTNIEGRVSTLETKVDELPDRVFEKIEAWQSGQEERITSEVRKIVETLAPPPPPVAVAAAAPVAEPVVVVEAPPPVPEPVAAVPEPAAPVVPASPLGSIPQRSGMPQAGDASGFKKGGFKFGGGGASWKDAVPASEPMAAAPVADVVPDPEPAPVAATPIPVPEPVAPVVPAAPLGSIPDRSGMPQAGGSGGFKKGGYKFGGGASWKNLRP